MKAEIHPYFYNSTVTCSCGNVFNTGATKPALRVEVCSK
ncbi:MAG: 50S ribosomal protein L31, partial [Chloroflexota bacterium]|nr:50S ribosomal protein L31 [Chloroflexota bacterium]